MNKSYCAVAFREIYVDSGGRYRMCCHARPKKNGTKWNNDTLPFDYFMSDEMEENRQKMFEGELIPECKTCYEIEKSSDQSYRTKANNSYGVSDEIHKLTVKVRAFGNYCNLACYMCHPYNSTTRQNEVNKVFADDYSHEKFIKNGGMVTKPKRNKAQDFEQYMNHILDNVHLIKKFQMIGGETLQLPKNWEFLERIPDEYAKNIHISLETNLTEITYKNHTIKNLLNRYKHVYVGVSVDHFGLKNEFIRYPIDQLKFESNVNRLLEMDNVEFKFNATVSFLNIDDILQIEEYYRTRFKKTITFHNIVRGPEFLSIRNLPVQLKKEYLKKYEKYSYIVAELNLENTMPVQTSIEYCDKLADHRGMDWRAQWSDFIEKLNRHDDIIAIC